jgi:hypothetical protein
MTFFIQWLMFEVRKDYLLKKCGAKEINYHGIKLLQVPKSSDIEKAPYLNQVKRILREIYDRLPEYHERFVLFDSFITNLASNLGKLKKDKSFFSIMDKLETQIYYSRKAKRSLDGEDVKFARRVSDFVRSKKQVSQRQLLRHFSNKREEDIVRLLTLLKIAGVSRKREGSRSFYQYQAHLVYGSLGVLDR